MSEWELQTLDQIVELRRGFDLPSRNRQGGSVPVLSAGSTAGWHDTPAVAGPGMVVGRATNLGVPTWSEKDFWPLNTTLYAADFYGNEPRWVFHLFETLDLAGYDSGSVQPMLNRNYIAKIRVKVPPLPIQQAIAEVLGALDDKIGANRKLAATADALARSIFAEAARDASLSEETYGDLAKIGGGGTPKSKVEEFWTGDVRWLTPTDVTALPGPYVEETSRRISEAGLASISSPLYPVGSIAMTSRATIGSFAILDRPMAVNQGFIVVEPYDENLRLWIFHEMRRRVREFYDYANGATFMELSRGNFKKIRVHLSDYNTMSRFGERVRPLHDSARLALRENETLIALREALLPRLMSGQLSVVDVAEMAGL